MFLNLSIHLILNYKRIHNILNYHHFLHLACLQNLHHLHYYSHQDYYYYDFDLLNYFGHFHLLIIIRFFFNPFNFKNFNL